MLKKDLVLRSPAEKIIGSSQIIRTQFGAVLSRAGVGKTTFLVQIALTQLLQDKKILHISLVEGMDKINLRYSEAYNNLVDSIGYVDPAKAHVLWEEIESNKVGISYTDKSLDTHKIRDYLNSFSAANLPMPGIIILDGLDFNQDVTTLLSELKTLHNEFSIPTWFSMQCHRDGTLDPEKIPVPLDTYNDFFDNAFLLWPIDSKIEVISLKKGNDNGQNILLDPANLMVLDQE